MTATASNSSTNAPARQGRTVIVTGASMGIGRVIAEAFVNAGDHVVMTARTADALEQAAAEISALGGPGKAIPLVCDASKPEGRALMIETAAKRTGAIDVLINNAGVYGPIGPLEEVSEDEWTYNIEINLIAPAALMRRVIPFMRKAGGGKIINLSGGGATKPTPTLSAYGAAKAGLVRLTETLAHELKTHNIQVNAVAPGFIATRFHAPIVDGSATIDASIAADTKKRVEKGGDDPKLAANLCLFLASGEANHITGRLLSAVFDDRAALTSPDTFRSEGFGTLRRVDNMFVFEKEAVRK